jgi:excinuclease UvrABC nuclease subunit
MTGGGNRLPISSFQNRLWEWAQESIDKIEKRPGVYEFYDSLEMIIFIGTATNLQAQLQEYYNDGFANNPCLRETTHFRVEHAENPPQNLKHHITVYQSTSGGTLPECMQ